VEQDRQEALMLYLEWLLEDCEGVISEDGTVVFNYLQQREEDTTERPLTPLEEAGGTDPDGITD
jgi:hypothetical protein